MIDADRVTMWNKWIQQQGFKRVAILAENTDYGVGLIEETKKQFGSMNVKAELKSIIFDRAVVDLTPQLLEIKNWKPDLFINVGIGTPMYLISKQAYDVGLTPATPMLISYDAPARPEYLKNLGDKGNYAELFGAPSDNNAATRSNGYETVLSQYPDLKKVAKEVANWDRTQGHNKMQSMLQANPDIVGVISGNDEMALGAIAALKEAGKLANIKVGGFDGSPDAVAAIKAGELQYTVLQPVAVFSEEAVKQADNLIKTGNTGAKSEKQLFDCLLITKDNIDKYTGPFVLAQ